MAACSSDPLQNYVTELQNGTGRVHSLEKGVMFMADCTEEGAIVVCRLGWSGVHATQGASSHASAPVQVDKYVHVTGYNLQFEGGVVREAWMCSCSTMETALEIMHGVDDTSACSASMLDELPTCIHSQAITSLRATGFRLAGGWHGGRRHVHAPHHAPHLFSPSLCLQL